MADLTSDRKLSRARETRSCAVPTCKNKRVGKKDDSGPSFHRFPKDPKIRREWIEQCQLSDTFNPDNASVCSDHFEFEDFERSYQKQLMGIERRPMLKKSVVPHQNLPAPPSSPRSSRIELRNRIKNKFQDLINVNDSTLGILDKKNCKIEMKTIDMLTKNDLPSVEAIILDYESDLESLCVQSVEDNSDSQTTLHSPIENIQIEPDYKTLYFQTLAKYEKLKSKMTIIEKDLAGEKKRVNDYQAMLTKIFSEGEIHLLCKKGDVS